jgi:hypothetical protein
MSSAGWFCAGAAVAGLGLGLWYRSARTHWLRRVVAVEAAAAAAQAAHAADSAALDARQAEAARLRSEADSIAQQARHAVERAGQASNAAHRLTVALAAAQTAGDSVPLLLARDSARVATIAGLEASGAGWRVAFERERERAGALDSALVVARQDAGRLAGVNADLRRQLAALVPLPPKTILGLPIPGRLTFLVVGAVAGALIVR